MTVTAILFDLTQNEECKDKEKKEKQTLAHTDIGDTETDGHIGKHTLAHTDTDKVVHTRHTLCVCVCLWVVCQTEKSHTQLHRHAHTQILEYKH